MAKTGRESVQQMLRLPDEMREKLRDAAEVKGRSLNAEIVIRLEKSFSFDAIYEGYRELQTENKYLREGLALLNDHRKISVKAEHSAATMLHVFASLLERYAEGNKAPLEHFVQNNQMRELLKEFPMPGEIEPVEFFDE